MQLRAQFEEKNKQDNMSATQNQTIITNDQTRLLSNQKTESEMMNTMSGPGRGVNNTRPSFAVFDEPSIIIGAPLYQNDDEDVRQSKSFRGPITSQKEQDKMLYYHLNDRLLDKKNRKLTPTREVTKKQRLQQQDDAAARNRGRYHSTIDPGYDVNTSRFGKDERQFFVENRGKYYQKRDLNL